MEVLEIKKMQEMARRFVKDRDWEKYQSPKNICIALSIEASELLEIFLWLNENESYQIKDNSKKFEEIKEEIADVLYWILRLSDILKIDLNDSFWDKIGKNEKKYPVDQFKGQAKKYNEI